MEAGQWAESLLYEPISRNTGLTPRSNYQSRETTVAKSSHTFHQSVGTITIINKHSKPRPEEIKATKKVQSFRGAESMCGMEPDPQTPFLKIHRHSSACLRSLK